MTRLRPMTLVRAGYPPVPDRALDDAELAGIHGGWIFQDSCLGYQGQDV